MNATEQTTATAGQQACITDGEGGTVILSTKAVSLLKQAMNLAKIENQFMRAGSEDNIDNDFEKAAGLISDATQIVWRKFAHEVDDCCA